MIFDAGYALDNRHFAPYSFALMILVTVVMTFASMFAFDLPNYWNMQLTNKSSILAEFYEMFTEMMKELTGGPFWSSFLTVAIFAPIFEEWLCRGMVLRGLLTKMKPGWAIVVSALFFAVIHANPWQALNAFMIGLVMGYVYYKTGSLILTMIIHFVNNGTSVILSHLDSMKDYADVNSWMEVMDKSTYMILFVVSCVILAACLWAFSRIPVENPWGNIDRIPPADETVVTETAADAPMPTDETPAASEELPADEDPAVPAE
jgi:membrane protease YdiL (CAAX protease family)